MTSQYSRWFSHIVVLQSASSGKGKCTIYAHFIVYHSYTNVIYGVILLYSLISNVIGWFVIGVHYIRC